MSLINYVEPSTMNWGSFFYGAGDLIICLVFAVVLWKLYGKIARWFDNIINRMDKYTLVEELMLDKVAKKKGLDLDKELMKRKMIENPKKKEQRSFQRKLQDEILDEWFGKDKKSDKE